MKLKEIFKDLEENQFDGIAFDYLTNQLKLKSEIYCSVFDYQNYQDENEILLPKAMEEFEKYGYNFDNEFYISFEINDTLYWLFDNQKEDDYVTKSYYLMNNKDNGWHGFSKECDFVDIIFRYKLNK